MAQAQASWGLLLPRREVVMAQGNPDLSKVIDLMGRDVSTLPRCVYTTLNINADVAQAAREMRAFVEGYYGAPYDVLARLQGLCAGTAATCAIWLQDFVASGAQTVVIRFGGPDQFVQLERCAKAVLPRLRG